MPRHRTFKFTLILLALAGVLYLMTSLYLPSPRRLIFGVDRTSGTIRRVDQSITFLPVHRFRRLSFEKRGELAHHTGIVKISSREEVPVLVAYRMRFNIGSSRLPDARRLVREGWPVWIGARVSEAVSAVTSQVPLEELGSPLSEFRSRRDRLREVVANHLAQSGVQVTAFEIERIDIDRDALLRYKRAELRRNVRGAFGRVVVISVEGADWELISELVKDGKLPNFEAVIDGGAPANLQTIQPTVSPLLGTTLATGVPPDRHGVIDFVDHRANSPALSSSRRVPALWEIAPAFGRPAGVVNWWTAWPPTSDEAFVFGTPFRSGQEQMVFPLNYAEHVRSVAVPESTIGYRQLARFVNITQAEYDRSTSGGGGDDPVAILRSVLARTWTDHRAALDYYRARRPMLFMVNFDGPDTVNHLFAPYHPPYREGIAAVEYRKYWPTVANYYAEIDRLLGEWMRAITAVGDDTTVIIVSSHGFVWGKSRPRTPPTGASALSSHRSPGIFIAWGSRVIHNPMRRTISIYDVAPTVLSLVGLPKSKEMPGNAVSGLFRNIEPVTGVPIASYSDLIDRGHPKASVEHRGGEYVTALRRIGHLNDPRRVAMPLLEEGQAVAGTVSPETWGRYAWLNNQGVQLKQQKKLKEASDAFEEAIALNPSRATAYLNFSAVLLEREFFTAAEDVFMKAIARGLPTPEKYMIDFAAYYRANDMPTRAINFLMKAREIFPQSYEVAANLGSALASAQRYTDAAPELERALGMRPASTSVLNNLGVLAVKRDDYGRALDYWNRSLAIEPSQPKIREAVEAARTRL